MKINIHTLLCIIILQMFSHNALPSICKDISKEKHDTLKTASLARKINLCFIDLMKNKYGTNDVNKAFDSLINDFANNYQKIKKINPKEYFAGESLMLNTESKCKRIIKNSEYTLFYYRIKHVKNKILNSKKHFHRKSTTIYRNTEIIDKNLENHYFRYVSYINLSTEYFLQTSIKNLQTTKILKSHQDKMGLCYLSYLAKELQQKSSVLKDKNEQIIISILFYYLLID